MYEQVGKPKGNKSRAVANSVVQKKKDGKQGIEFVDNRPEYVVQRKVTGFKSTGTPIDIAAKAYLSNTDETQFDSNKSGDNVRTSLSKILPHTVSHIQKIQSVQANVTPNGPSEWTRDAVASAHVGRAGRQEAILTTGSDPYYQGGHLISHSLLGTGSVASTAVKVDSYQNLVPMEAALNNMTYKALETKIGATSGTSSVKIDVQTNPNLFVSHENISKLTGCPLNAKYKLNTGVYIPSAIARTVTVSVGGAAIGDAAEIGIATPHEAIMTTGAQLLDHLDKTGAMPWISKSLENDVMKII
ncbi:MAG: hypothetical protein CENE_00269 [Candidatus Celerinatantimonas neptuna]|nr:MAG: hypothetical protein CENE_00269 [Candidatus Celerinatantimonas neptuna]